jgi:exosortase/archaeosortase family protein
MSGLASPLATRVACAPIALLPLPPLAWIGLHALALWPHGAWAWQRLRDGSDDPLGVIALAALLWLVWRERAAMRVSPRLPWLVCGVVLALAATLALPRLPSLVAASIAALSIACSIVAWLPGGTPRVPFAGLAFLSLPLVASLQFYVGYPLRVVTAQLSTWVLELGGIDAMRSGASMTVRGQLVIVDAPCSGVQMAWMAYFAACAVAAHRGLGDAAFLRRLPWVGVIVLAGNALRNSVLVALEARPQGLAPAMHEAIGLAALALTTLVVTLTVRRGGAR